MAKRYIDVDGTLENLPDDLKYKASVKRVLMQTPEADVAEVVRCKDCKYYETHRPIHKKVCEKNEGHLIPMQPDDFCSYGERRKDDDVL